MDFNAPRLFLDQLLAEGALCPLDRDRTSYLANVLRLKAGDDVLVFNGRDGEWLSRIEPDGRRTLALRLIRQLRAQEGGPDILYLFAPLKRARLDYMVQKATELGVATLQPVMTERTNAERVNLERMRANVVEAAEQCGILRIPAVLEPLKLPMALAALPAGQPLVFCDEAADLADPVAALAGLASGPVAVLIGPEGGFSATERAMLLSRADTIRLSLGPRIMRADTAAVAALALVNAVAGDWRAPR